MSVLYTPLRGRREVTGTAVTSLTPVLLVLMAG